MDTLVTSAIPRSQPDLRDTLVTIDLRYPRPQIGRPVALAIVNRLLAAWRGARTDKSIVCSVRLCSNNSKLRRCLLPLGLPAASFRPARTQWRRAKHPPAPTPHHYYLLLMRTGLCAVPLSGTRHHSPISKQLATNTISAGAWTFEAALVLLSERLVFQFSLSGQQREIRPVQLSHLINTCLKLKNNNWCRQCNLAADVGGQIESKNLSFLFLFFVKNVSYTVFRVLFSPCFLVDCVRCSRTGSGSTVPV